MTYKEDYEQCKTEAEFKEKLEKDLWVAKFMGATQGRVDAIMKAAQEVADAKEWIKTYEQVRCFRG